MASLQLQAAGPGKGVQCTDDRLNSRKAEFALLVGSEAFADRALDDMRRARSRLYVQAMTFEADAAGGAVADAIRKSAARDRRVLVDDYTRWVINDRLVLAPHNLVDRALQAEARATRGMFRALAADGAPVRVTNPIAPFMLGLPFRNHKKLIVADDVAYVGGLNFSDHNFAWRDLMLRIEGPGPAGRLAADFDSTWEGRAVSWSEDFGGLRLIGFDGRDNARGFEALMARIDEARREIVVVSPYLTFPFIGVLERAASRGVEVRLITPLANNKPLVRDYLLWAAAKSGFEVHLTREMIHLKGMLIDERMLTLGSSNFDFVSFTAEEELLAVVSDPALIAAFRADVLEPLQARALPAGAYRPGLLAGPRAALLLRTADLLIRALPYGRRSARPW
jgi:cardiolipin synthase